MERDVTHDIDLEHRLDRMEQEIGRLRRRSAVYKVLAIGAVAAAIAGPAVAGGKKSLLISSADDKHELSLEPDHIEFRVDGKPRMRMEVGEDWSSQTFYAPDGTPTWLAGSDKSGTSLKLFKADGQLRVEIADELLDTGSGVRLYDPQGNPRATMYSNRRNGESGMELADPDRQPRIGVYALPDGVSVLRASTSSADALAELSILPRSDAMSRYTGGIPEPIEGEPFVPMLYLLDATGKQELITTARP